MLKLQSNKNNIIHIIVIFQGLTADTVMTIDEPPGLSHGFCKLCTNRMSVPMTRLWKIQANTKNLEHKVGDVLHDLVPAPAAAGGVDPGSLLWRTPLALRRPHFPASFQMRLVREPVVIPALEGFNLWNT